GSAIGIVRSCTAVGCVKPRSAMACISSGARPILTKPLGTNASSVEGASKETAGTKASRDSKLSDMKYSHERAPQGAALPSDGWKDINHQTEGPVGRGSS